MLIAECMECAECAYLGMNEQLHMSGEGCNNMIYIWVRLLRLDRTTWHNDCFDSRCGGRNSQARPDGGKASARIEGWGRCSF